MRNPFVLLLSLLLFGTSQIFSNNYDQYNHPTDTIFINPQATGSSETGTRENPWLAFRANHQMPDNRVYAVKGGTTLFTSNTIQFYGRSLLTITSYDTTGVGNATIRKTNNHGRVIHITGSESGPNGTDTTTVIRVNNLNLYHPGRHTVNQNTGEALTIRLYGGKALVNNVHTVGGHQGINITGYSKPDLARAYVMNSTMDSTFDDGMYMTQLRSLIISNCKTTHSGLFWPDHPSQPSGDGLHTWQVRNITIEHSTLDRSATGGKFALIGTETMGHYTIKNSILIGHFFVNIPGQDSVSAVVYKGNGHWTFENSVIIDARYGIWNYGLSLHVDNCLFVGQNIAINSLNANNTILNSTFAEIGTRPQYFTHNSVFFSAWGSQNLNVSNSNFVNYNRLFLSIGDNVNKNFNGNNYFNYTIDESSQFGANATTHNPQFAETIFYQLSPGSPLRNAGPGGRNVGFCLDVAGSVGYKPITGNSGTDPEVPPTWNVGFNVTGANNAAITNATITFNGHTNPAGSYSFPNTPSGTHTYSVSAPHHQTLSGQSVTVANHMTIPVTLTPVSYNVTITASPSAGGTFTGNGSYAYGQSATVTATPAAGYNFVNWTVNGNPVSTQASYTFTVTGNRNLVANFSQNTYSVSLSSSPAAGGTTTGAGNYTHGQSVTVTATPAAGYNFVNWTVNGNPVSTQASYTFTVTGNRNLVANFSQNTYSVSLSSSPAAGGTTTGAGNYTHGQSATVTATSAAGYNFVNWTVNGNPVSTQASYTFTVTGNRNLVANFSQNTYSVSLSSSPAAGGTTTGAGNYTHGQSATVTATPAAGYNFVNWTVNGNPVSTQASYTFTVTSNRNLVANFSQNTYSVSLSSSPAAGGTTTGAGNYTHGQSATVTATPAAGYNFVNWTVNGNPVSTQASYTFTVTGNRNLVANFSQNTYSVSLSSSPAAGGTTTGAGNYNHGQTATVTATANTGFSFINWTENGTPVSSQAFYAFTVNGNRNLVANFNANAYSLTVNAVPLNGGTVSGSGVFAHGQSVTVSAQAAQGYAFNSWTINGQAVSSNPVYSFTITDNTVISANFQQQQQFTVSTQSQPLQGGYTTGQGSFYANQTATLEAVPYPGYNFLHWQYQNLIYSNQPEISVTVNSDMHFTAVFSAASAQVAVLVDVTPTGFGFINGTGTYIQGQNVTLQANSIDATIAFIGYYENGELLETSPEITFIADDNRQIQALFRHFSRDFEVKASLATPAFQNIVEIHGAGSYPEGETASLSVTISDQVTFVGWQNKAGQIVSRMNPYVFEVNRNVELEAILRAGPVQAATERISPNPSNGQFNLSLQEDSEVNIFNANGVLLYSRYMPAGNNPVDLPDLPTGLYLVQIKNQQKTETQRLIIKY